MTERTLQLAHTTKAFPESLHLPEPAQVLCELVDGCTRVCTRRKFSEGLKRPLRDGVPQIRICLVMWRQSREIGNGEKGGIERREHGDGPVCPRREGRVSNDVNS